MASCCSGRAVRGLGARWRRGNPLAGRMYVVCVLKCAQAVCRLDEGQARVWRAIMRLARRGGAFENGTDA